jgi:catechol-2,3-dioxygenase
MKTDSTMTLLRLFLLFSCARSVNALSMSTCSSTYLSLGGQTLRNIVLDAAEHDVSTTLDVKGVLWTEHINLVVGSKKLAEYFYLNFLGFSRDAGKSFHVNLGQQQFHLAENGEPAQRIAGSIGLVVPSLDKIRDRIADAQIVLKDTQFAIESDNGDCITITCPWGNHFHLYSVEDESLVSTLSTPRKMENMHAKGGAYGSHRMAVRGGPGIRFIEIACPPNKSRAISKFYQEMIGCTVMEAPEKVVVCVGPGVHVVFVESNDLSEMDVNDMKGVHVCFYAEDFEGLYHRLAARNLIWTNPRFLHLDSCKTWQEAAASRTLRFKDVIDLDSGEKILELEHETRPLRHGQFMKVPLYEPK